MRAAVVHELGGPLVVEERPDPVPGRGEVLVRIEASGLCHTDIHAANGDWPVKPVPPSVPGHAGVTTYEVNESFADVLEGNLDARLVFGMTS